MSDQWSTASITPAQGKTENLCNSKQLGLLPRQMDVWASLWNTKIRHNSKVYTQRKLLFLNKDILKPKNKYKEIPRKCPNFFMFTFCLLPWWLFPTLSSLFLLFKAKLFLLLSFLCGRARPPCQRHAWESKQEFLRQPWVLLLFAITTPWGTEWDSERATGKQTEKRGERQRAENLSHCVSLSPL